MKIIEFLVAVYLCSIAFNAIVLWLVKRFDPEGYEDTLADKTFSADFLADCIIFIPILNTIGAVLIIYTIVFQDLVLWIYRKYLWMRLLQKLSPETRAKIKQYLDEYRKENQSSDSEATSLEERPPGGQNNPSDENKSD